MRRRAIRLESLEPRWVLDGAAGFLLGADAYTTFSFAPNGTDIAGNPSSFDAAFGAIASQEEWQGAILEAFQTWAVHTNADIGVVPDSGDPFGVSGPIRGDTRFGDIRIGAAPLSPDVFAVSVPLPTGLTGTWVGDVVFNTNAPFTDRDDIFAVALHEAGNIFGLSDGSDPLSPMFSPGIPTATEPTSTDLADLVARYGTRVPDFNEGDTGGLTGNDTFGTATVLKVPEVGEVRDGSAPAIVYGDIAGGQDIDRFRIEVPSEYSGPVTATVRSRHISLLAPQVTLYGENQQFLAQSASAEPAGGVTVVQLASVGSNESFFVDVRSVDSGLFATGGYSLVVTFDANLQTDQETIDTIAGGRYRYLEAKQIEKFFDGPDDDDDPLFGEDFHQNENPLGATTLDTAAGFVEFTRYETIASITDASDVDYYRITSASVPVGQPNVMTVSVRSLKAGGLIPKVTLLDKNLNVVPAAVLVNGSGDLVVQAAGVEPEEVHYIRVESADTGGVFASGNYQLHVVFGSETVQFDSFAAGTLSSAEPLQVQGLFVARTQLFHIVLDVADLAAPADVAVLATIVDEDLQPVYQIAVGPGEVRSGKSVLLAPGTYGVQIIAATLDGSPLPDVDYAVRGLAVSDPLAIDPSDPTADPSFTCPGIPGMFCFPGPIITDNPYLWLLFLDNLPGDPAASSYLNGVAAVASQSTPDTATLVAQLLGDWWFWVWDRDGTNGPPLAFNNAYSVPQGGTLAVAEGLGVLANDLDPESDTLAAILVDDIPPGQGVLTLQADGSFSYVPPNPTFTGVVSFTYMASDFNQTSNTTTVTLTVHSTAGAYVAGRQLLYNNSSFDGNTPAADPQDDLAIAPDKVALLPLSTASFVNYSSYSRGINGLIVDIDGLADPVGIGVENFVFRTGNDGAPETWPIGPAPTSVSVRPGQGVQGADRVTVLWPDHAIESQWLEITVLAGPTTGLSQDDRFYFGNAPGETGDSSANAVVNDQDLQLALANQRGPFAPAARDDPYDFNRDRMVNATDVLLARNEATNPLNALQLITLFPPAAAAAATAENTASAEGAAEGDRGTSGSLPVARAVEPAVTTRGVVEQDVVRPAWRAAPAFSAISRRLERSKRAGRLDGESPVRSARDAVFNELGRTALATVRRPMRVTQPTTARSLPGGLRLGRPAWERGLLELPGGNDRSDGGPVAFGFAVSRALRAGSGQRAFWPWLRSR